jgi:hypothetical protein
MTASKPRLQRAASRPITHRSQVVVRRSGIVIPGPIRRVISSTGKEPPKNGQPKNTTREHVRAIMTARIGLAAIQITLAAIAGTATASAAPAVPGADRAPQLTTERGGAILVAESKKKAKKQQQNQRQSAPPAGGREERGS